ncbi:hypothetical protein ACHHV8_11220 [Paenibacillus sp. TAB 01]|uniref:hypothetical protein n=1 Tax=Paenibacillus sp. TAB 01 TaxID=3368988 RepID=UPI0037530771
MVLTFKYPGGEYRTDEILSYEPSPVVNSQTRSTAGGKTDTVFIKTTGQMDLEIQLDVYEPELVDALIAAAQNCDDIQLYKNGVLVGTFRVPASIKMPYVEDSYDTHHTFTIPLQKVVV